MVSRLEISTDSTCKFEIGAEYDFSQETKAAIQFSETIEGFDKIKETIVVI